MRTKNINIISHILHTLSTITILNITISFQIINNTSALTYQNETNIDFTINPTIGITLSSSSLTIDDLAPGSSADSNIMTIDVNSNASHGYYLSVTVGDSNTASTNHNNNLTNSADNNYAFTSLTSNKTTLSNFNDNNWGYSYCLTANDCTTSDNWISGSYDNTAVGYNGLPLDNGDNGTTGIALINTTTPTANSSIQFKIGAKASDAQASGTYTNTVNFYAVTNPEADNNTMQNFAAGNASTTCSAMSVGDTLELRDSRDNTKYLIGKLADDNCWLLNNLALDLTNQNIQNNLTAETTNATDLSLSYLKGEVVRDATADPNGNYPTAKVATDWSTYDPSKPYILTTEKDTIPQGEDPMADAALAGGWKSGIYYSFCAASGGSYCYNNYVIGNDVTGASEDICPAGWRLPTGGTSGEFNALALAITGSSSYISDSNKISAFRNALRLPYSGTVSGGSVVAAGSSPNLWTSTRDWNEIKDLRGSTTSINPALDGMPRYNGEAVRCILKQ